MQLDLLSLVLGGVGGGAFGALGCALLVNARHARAQDVSQAQASSSEARAAASDARAVSAEAALADAHVRARTLETVLADVQREAGELAEARAAAVARAERIAGLEAELDAVRRAESDARARVAELDALLAAERAAATERAAAVAAAESRLSDTFKALAADALAANNEGFAALAASTIARLREMSAGDAEARATAVEQLVTPVRTTLGELDAHLRALEVARAGAYEGLREQVRALADSQQALRAETGNLVRALRAPATRGRWGELQLRRVVELAGMVEHADFEEQHSVTRDGERLRPDLVVQLPGGRCIAVDAKTPLEAFLDAADAVEEGARRDALARHARHVREHVRALAARRYDDALPSSPELVVLFLPGEHFLTGALEQDPALVEDALALRIVVATPTTLVALLKAVAYGWRQERVAANARAISEAGAELHKRVGDFAGHLEGLGKRLSGAVAAYNGAVGSLESRVLPGARRLKELGAAPNAAELAEVPTVELAVREARTQV
jgi:DNA recombination protein RmuC